MEASMPWLARVRHQAEVLGNTVRAMELVHQAQAGADPELRFHLGEYERWLRQDHREPGAGEGVLALLLDVDHSGEGFVARLSLEPRTELHRSPLPPDCGAAFAEAVERAGAALMHTLWRRGLFSPASSLLSDQRFVLRGAAAARHWVKDGGSIGAAAAVALYSAWTGVALPRGIAVTGGVDARGKILPVGGLLAKVRAVLRERPGVRLVVVPREHETDNTDGLAEAQDPRVRGVETVEQLLELVFGAGAMAARAAGPVDIEGTVRLGVELYEKRGSFAFAAEVLSVALQAIDRARVRGELSAHRPEELTASWRLGSAMIHLGQTAEAEALLGRARELAEALWQAQELDPRVYLGFRGNLAVLLRDLFRPAEAEVLLRQNLILQRQLRQAKREQAKTLGNLGELLTYMDRFQEAEEALDEALEFIRAVYPDEIPRELCYLGNLHLRRGEPGQALEVFREGLLANCPVQYGQETNEAFLRLGTVRALAALGRHRRAVAEADRALVPLSPGQPYPRAFIIKYRGLALLAAGDGAAGCAALEEAADTTFVRGPLMRFGVSTALGELARFLLASGDPQDVTRARSLAIQLAEAALEVPGLEQSGAKQMLRLSADQALDAGALARAVETLCAWFYYG